MTNKQPQYDETFKKNIVALHQNGKTQTELSKEYGISVSAISRWIKWNCQEMCSRRIPKILDRQESGGVMRDLF